MEGHGCNGCLSLTPNCRAERHWPAALLLANKFFFDLTGVLSKVLWLPDVFGYSACWPQIMRQSGVEFFFTTKLTLSVLNRFPYDSFRWRSPDGSEVIAHLSTGGNGYNSHANATELINSTCQYRQADIHEEFLLPVGYGDGGGGVTADILERASRYRQVPQLPAVSWGRIDIHYWQRLVFAQFHDYIPGSSIDAVYEEHVPELRALASQALTATAEVLGGEAAISEVISGWFNPLPYPMRIRHQGKSYRLAAATITPTSEIVEEANLPKLLRDDRALLLDNGRTQASFSPAGEIMSIVVDACPIEFEGAAVRLALHQDKPSNFDRWDIDHHMLVHPKFLETDVSVAASDAEGEVGFAFTRGLGAASSVTTRYSLRAGENLLRITFELDWHEPRRLLRVHFPTRYRWQDAIFRAPFRSTLRSQLQTGPVAEAMWEVPGSRWAAVTHSFGRSELFLVTQAKYGFACRDGNLQLSLVHSPESGETFTYLGFHRIELAIGRFASDAPREEQPFALADTLFTSPLALRGMPVRRSPPTQFIAGNSLHLTWIKPLSDVSCILRFNEIPDSLACCNWLQSRVSSVSQSLMCWIASYPATCQMSQFLMARLRRWEFASSFTLRVDIALPEQNNFGNWSQIR